MTDGAATEQARTYLAAFLPQGRADELAREAVDEAGPEADRATVLAATHRRLLTEARVTEAVAADVLVRDLGLPADEAAVVLGVPDEQVAAAVDEATAIEQELGGAEAPPPPPPSPPRPDVRYVFDTEAPPEPAPAPQETPAFERARERPGRRALTLGVVVLVIAAVLLAVIVSTGGGAGGDDDDGTSPAATVTITEARTTDEVTTEGPGAPREVFSPDEPVILWFAFEPVDGEAIVELVVLRDGEELISPAFPLPRSRNDSHVPLPRVVTEEVGSYRVELRHDGRVLVRTGFEVRAQ